MRALSGEAPMRATGDLAFPITHRTGTKPVEDRQDAISFDWERWCGQLSTPFGRGCRFRSETRDHAQIRLRGPALRTRFRRTPTLCFCSIRQCRASFVPTCLSVACLRWERVPRENIELV